MPLLPNTMIQLLTGYLAASGIIGISAPQLATAISNGFVQYVTSSVIVITVDVGAIGAGSGIGAGLVLAPPVLSGFLGATLAGAKLFGIMSPSMITAISSAVSDMLKQALINTVNVGVGVGAGKVTLIPNPAASVPIMVASFLSAGLIGIGGPVLASAIALGIDQALPTALGVVAITGVAGPSPGAGTGVGKLN